MVASIEKAKHKLAEKVFVVKNGDFNNSPKLVFAKSTNFGMQTS